LAPRPLDSAPFGGSAADAIIAASAQENPSVTAIFPYAAPRGGVAPETPDLFAEK
jgi:hypothetical protein